MKISFIGYGNMAKAIIAKLKPGRTLQIAVASPSLRPGIQEGISWHYDNLAIIADADVIILAVKPTKMAAVLKQIGSNLPMKALIISVAAGINLQWLQKHCPNKQAIVRCMPNILVSIGKGAIPIIANQYLSPLQKKQTEKIFKQAGLIHWLDNEALLDPFTALSGSGPAYVYLFIEAMTEAATKLGIEEEIASSFAQQTLSGSVALMEQSGLSAEALRKKVTSPAGTTAAAIGILQQGEFKALIFEAMQAACKRATELGLLDNN